VRTIGDLADGSSGGDGSTVRGNSTATATRSRTASTTPRISIARWCSTTALCSPRKITEFLKESGDRFQKTIVFCVDEEHAARMRQALVNENADLVAENQRYVMRITGSDKEGQDQLGNFIDPESKYPVLVTTSRLLSTGVDAQTCRLIVLDRAVGSMTEFKQIVGRGTRVHEDTKKFFFTLMDFRGATSHFADPDFDGDSRADLRAE
jgi:type I restriction enzyme R subunit